jgi:hypothetical protein
MTDSSHEADLSIDAISAIEVDDHQSEVSMESITAGSSAAEDDPNSTSASFDVNKEDDDSASGGQHGRSRRKRQRANFPWSHTHDWTSGDPSQQRGRRKCMECPNWFSSGTNAQGWKIHLSKQHHITATSLQEQSSQTRPAGRQAISHLIKHCKVNKERLLRVDPSLSAADMKAKLEVYEKKLVRLPAIVARYLNPQIHMPTDQTKLKELRQPFKLSERIATLISFKLYHLTMFWNNQM